ncbi:lysine-rich arabinogalactan protein 19 [Momordica charantia]|uniref:Lysine-rich arabinogalactan protein 19 n=1 Tax=Momordica charantia TaxID=3673 RepID=A0A6J1DGE9_MOMCH|nr:lysine-rich arabinogalactan protein 19 [Momordica charantia]
MPADSPLIPTTTTPPAAATAAPVSYTLAPTAATTTAAAAAIARPLANQAPSRPISSIPPTHHLHYPPQALYTAQPIPVRTPNQQLPKVQQDASQGILYPVASSGRGFVPRPIRPLPADQAVTVANAAGFPHRPVVTFPHRPVGSPHLDAMSHPMHMGRPPNLQQQQLLPLPGSATAGSIKGAPNSSDPKVFPPSTICESNGCKEMRDRVRDDTLCVIRDRKVRITDGASLYALCRSWLRNGSQEENQPQYGNFLRSLPRPLPIPVAGAIPSQKKEVTEEEVGEDDKDEQSIAQLSTQELLKRHVRRAKKVRSRLREERLQRIERYKTRLALLLPPPVEQLRTDNAAGS